MRRSLWWALGATVGLSLLSMAMPRHGPALIAAIEPRIQEHARSFEALSASNGPGRPAMAPLPDTLPPLDHEPAGRDFLASRAPPPLAARPASAAPPPPSVSSPTLPAVPPPPPAAPQAPPTTWRYMGSMVSPDGRRLIYLAKGDAAQLVVAAGDRLDDGYVVESIDAEAIGLVYPPSGTKVMVPMPPAAGP